MARQKLSVWQGRLATSAGAEKGSGAVRRGRLRESAGSTGREGTGEEVEYVPEIDIDAERVGPGDGR